MGIKYYLKAAISEYTDKDGQPKKRYQTIGIVTETKKGDLMAKIEMLPLLGMKEGAFWCYLNEPEEKTDQPKGLANIDENIPF